MLVFSLTKSKPIYLLLANSGSKKNFFLGRQNCGMLQISLISTKILNEREKSVISFHFCVFFYLNEGNLEATSLACISDFVDKNARRNDYSAENTTIKPSKIRVKKKK